MIKETLSIIHIENELESYFRILHYTFAHSFLLKHHLMKNRGNSVFGLPIFYFFNHVKNNIAF